MFTDQTKHSKGSGFVTEVVGYILCLCNGYSSEFITFLHCFLWEFDVFMFVEAVGRHMLFMGKPMTADVKKEVQVVSFGRFVQLWHLNISDKVAMLFAICHLILSQKHANHQYKNDGVFKTH